MGSVSYELEATIERAGAFKSNLAGKADILLVRNPAEQNLETFEPISVARTWYSPYTLY
jgi:arrestin-related trafficking adapter 3/6